MTSQESFKRRIRTRMAKTGERYNAARRSLMEQATPTRTRTWVAEPEMSDDAVRAATGRGWEEWCQVIDDWSGKDQGHTAIAKHLQDALSVDDWWAQGVTVGYERITGLRLPYQRADGTFTAGKSRTVAVEGNLLRKMLLSDEDRRDLFSGHATELLSRPDAKSIRVAMDRGVAQFAIEPMSDGRAKVSVNHERLPSYAEVDEWKHFWNEWLDAIDGDH